MWRRTLRAEKSKTSRQFRILQNEKLRSLNRLCTNVRKVQCRIEAYRILLGKLFESNRYVSAENITGGQCI